MVFEAKLTQTCGTHKWPSVHHLDSWLASFVQSRYVTGCVVLLTQLGNDLISFVIGYHCCSTSALFYNLCSLPCLSCPCLSCPCLTLLRLPRFLVARFHSGNVLDFALPILLTRLDTDVVSFIVGFHLYSCTASTFLLASPWWTSCLAPISWTRSGWFDSSLLESSSTLVMFWT